MSDTFTSIGGAAAGVVQSLEGRMGEVVVRNEAPLAPVGMTPMAMLQAAVERGAGIDVMERLMSLQERWEANEARKAFNAAIANAKAEIPVIFKNREVDFTSAKGRTHYRHEDLAGIASVVDPILAKHGLSYRFRTQSPVNEPVTVTCIISHRDGYFEENTLSAGRDDTGNKNSHQAVASAVTYLSRYTLKAALGLAASADDDGAKADATKTITGSQVSVIQKKIVDTGTDIAGFMAFMSKACRVTIERVEDIPADEYQRAVTALDEKARKTAKAQAAE